MRRRPPPTRRPAPGVDLTARVGSVHLPNPVMTAAGTAGYGTELAPYFALASLGAVVPKSLSSDPWEGNPAPRVHEAGEGMLNSVGLQNPGVTYWLGHHLPLLAAQGARVVVSIWGMRTAGYRAAAAEVAAAAGDGVGRAIVAIEANISCPNVEDRREMFAHHPESAAGAVAAAVEGAGGRLPVWAKLSPNVTDLPAIAGAVLGAGAAAVVLTNTLMGLAVDPVSGRAVLGAGGGGLSGPPLHPVAVRAVFECRRAFPDAAIVGVGGVRTGRDAAEFLAAGADAVQVGTATFAEPTAPARVLGELREWCAAQGIEDLSQLVGRAQRGVAAGVREQKGQR